MAAGCVSLLSLVMPRRATSKIKPDQNPIGLIGDAQFLAKISVMLLGKQVADPKTLKFLLVPLGDVMPTSAP
jgi:hypothetical protein